MPTAARMRVVASFIKDSLPNKVIPVSRRGDRFAITVSKRTSGPEGLSCGAMDMTPEEVKQFWRDYCQRRAISKDIVARGEAKIDENPDYWADQTMGRLLD